MIDLDTAKAHLRVDATDEDALITAYIGAAQAAVEGATSKFFAPTSVLQTMDGFPRVGRGDRPIRLWNGPVGGDGAITEIAYDDGSGNEHTLTNFRLIEGANAKILPAYGECWPLTICREATVRVTYMAGYADGEVPPALDHAVLLLTAHYYANREAAVVGERAAALELPLGVDLLINRYRTPRLG